MSNLAGFGQAMAGWDNGAALAQQTLVQPTVAIGIVKCRGPQDAKDDGATTETLVAIPFGVEFSKRPAVSFGYAFPADSVRVSGRLPRCSAIVVSWTQAQRGTEVHYLAMTVGVVIDGPVGTKVELMWTAVEQAYTGGV